jgi:hypothetical protein
VETRSGSLPNLQTIELATESEDTVWSAVKQLAVRMMDNIKHVLPTRPDPRFTRPVPIAPECFTYPTTDQQVGVAAVAPYGVL